MSKINVSTETLRGVNEEIEAITEALIQNKTELKSLMEQINNKIASDEVKPRLVAYGEILEEVCKNTNQTLASLKEYLGNQIEKYERIDAESREKLASEARILEQLETEDGAVTAAGAAAVAGGAALAGGGNEDTADQVETVVDNNAEDISDSWDGKRLTRSGGVNEGPSGHETWYSQKKLPGGGLTELNNNGRHVEKSDGTIRDKDNYIAVASDVYPKGTVVPTSLGLGKVYDTGVGHNGIDIYTNW